MVLPSRDLPAGVGWLCSLMLPREALLLCDGFLSCWTGAQSNQLFTSKSAGTNSCCFAPWCVKKKSEQKSEQHEGNADVGLFAFYVFVTIKYETVS